MLKISHSKRFKKDFAQYKRDIEKISNERVKKDCQILLNKIAAEYNYIDSAHILNRDIDPIKVRENVEIAAQLRLKLNKIIAESKN